MIRKPLLVWTFATALAFLALTGCAAQRQQATPTAIPLSDDPQQATATASPAASLPVAPTPTPGPASADLPSAIEGGEVSAAAQVEPVVRSGRLSNAVAVRAQPDEGAASAGDLPAGALVIVTGQQGDWREIIFSDAPGGHGWVPAAAIGAAPAQPTPTISPVPESAAARDEAVPTPLAIESPQPEVVQPAPARPASQLAGTLVFQESNGGNIYLMNADGSGLRRLTYGFEPALSPDGSQVAFTRWDEPRGLWVINVDGTGARHLFTANRPRSPTWTPDGSAIVFERNTRDRTCRLSPFGCLSDDELFNLFGGQSCLTTPFGTICIGDFSVTTQYASTLTLYDLASGTVRDLPVSESAMAPQHRPVDSAVLYLDGGGLALTRTDSNDPPQRLVQTPPLLAPGNYSPDGQWIYAARNEGNRWDLWRWRADGSQPAALTAPDPLAANPPNHVAPAVSPDGRHVAFLTNRTGPWELWVMDSDGGNPRPLAPQALAGINFRYDYNAERMVNWGR